MARVQALRLSGTRGNLDPYSVIMHVQGLVSKHVPKNERGIGSVAAWVEMQGDDGRRTLAVCTDTPIVYRRVVHLVTGFTAKCVPDILP